MLRLGLGGRKGLDPQHNSGCQRERLCHRDRNSSCKQPPEFWGKGSVYTSTGSLTEVELQQRCKRGAKGQDNKLRGSCTDNFFIWARVFCFHLLTSESYQIAGFHLSLLLLYELMKKTLFPIPKFSKTSTSHLSFNLNFEFANFCLTLWLSQKKILCGFIVK